jgi:hypothetical protein
MKIHCNVWFNQTTAKKENKSRISSVNFTAARKGSNWQKRWRRNKPTRSQMRWVMVYGSVQSYQMRSWLLPDRGAAGCHLRRPSAARRHWGPGGEGIGASVAIEAQGGGNRPYLWLSSESRLLNAISGVRRRQERERERTGLHPSSENKSNSSI